MFKNFVILIIVTIFFTLKLQGQATASDTGRVSLKQDHRIKELIDKEIEINKKKEGKIPGYRVQIHFGSDREKAKDVRTQFINKYVDTPAYEEYEQPHFKIRVGNFKTKLEAYKYLKEISLDFPSSFIVQDDIISLGEIKQ